VADSTTTPVAKAGGIGTTATPDPAHALLSYPRVIFDRPARQEEKHPQSLRDAVPPSFHWTTFDVNSYLPAGWQAAVHALADRADFHNFPRTPVLSREAEDIQFISRGRVHADQVRLKLPWLLQAYHGAFLKLARTVCAEPVTVAHDDRYGVVLNVQKGQAMRFECHVDSNPLTGLLFCSDHDGGGELVVAHDTTATDIGAVERSCSVIRPHAGHLIFFDARNYPHYARPLTVDGATRIVAVMNFYIESFPESTRPRELNRHLYGDG
jgi:hypothetical protein